MWIYWRVRGWKPNLIEVAREGAPGAVLDWACRGLQLLAPWAYPSRLCYVDAKLFGGLEGAEEQKNFGYAYALVDVEPKSH